MHLHTDHIKVARTSGRVLSIILFILWGSFFVERLSWLAAESAKIPSVRIWFVQCTHLLLLVGYLVSLKWEKTGSILIVLNAVLFFGFSMGRDAFPFIIVSLFPVMMFAYCWMKTRRSNVRLVHGKF